LNPDFAAVIVDDRAPGAIISWNVTSSSSVPQVWERIAYGNGHDVEDFFRVMVAVSMSHIMTGALDFGSRILSLWCPGQAEEIQICKQRSALSFYT
jgi:hypothetical protein